MASKTSEQWPHRTQPSEIFSWSGTTLNRVPQAGHPVKGQTAAGIYLNNLAGGTVSGNVSHDNSAHGIYLAGSTTGVTVTEIAAHWGFFHPGHFASYYRRTYGRPPSWTLLRGPPRPYPGL